MPAKASIIAAARHRFCNALKSLKGSFAFLCSIFIAAIIKINKMNYTGNRSLI